VVNSGQSIRIVAVNDGAVMSWAGAFATEFGALASLVAADPGRTQVGYFVATDGRYELSCGTESMASEPMTFEVE